jgi:hypothetical protein
MQTHRFGRKIKLPATIAIKHQINRLILEDAIKTEAAEHSKAIPPQLDEGPRVLSL